MPNLIFVPSSRSNVVDLPKLLHISFIIGFLGVWNVKTTSRKSWAVNVSVRSDVTFDYCFMIKGSGLSINTLYLTEGKFSMSSAELVLARDAVMSRCKIYRSYSLVFSQLHCSLTSVITPFLIIVLSTSFCPIHILSMSLIS